VDGAVKRLWGVALLVAGCPRPMDPEQPCVEIATAIGARTQECTGDGELGVARIDAVLQGYECLDRADAESFDGYAGEQAFGCALVLRNLACELVLEDGDDLDAWLSRSASCANALERR
jgi:hypothetical protein